MNVKYHYDHTQICEWCGEHFECRNPRTLTCGPRCRTNRSRYKGITGFFPERPPGRVTAYIAYLDLAARLLAVERARRQRLDLLRAGPETLSTQRTIVELMERDPFR